MKWMPRMSLWSRSKTEEEDESEDGDSDEDEYKYAEEQSELAFINAVETNPAVFDELLSNLTTIEPASVTRMLGWAVFNRKPPDVIMKIGEECANISAHTLDRSPAIHLAVQANYALGLRQLLSMGADVNSKSGNKVFYTALHVAVHTASLECVHVLLEQDSIEIDVFNFYGDTALGMCSLGAKEDGERDEQILADIAALLISRGADVNKGLETEAEDTPLWRAIERNMCRIVKEMLRLGQKPPASVVTSYVDSVRRGGAKYENMLGVLVEAGWGSRVAEEPKTISASGSAQHPSRSRTPSQTYTLHDAARSGNVGKLVELLSSGKDVNAVDSTGCTALHVAATSGHDDVLRALLRAGGVRVDKPDRDRLTALYRAAKADKIGAVKALLGAGASRDVKDARGLSVMHEVAARPAGAVIEALLDGGVSPGLGGEKGLTPLHTACMVDPPGTVQALLRGGALAGHCWNDLLQSPLMVACKHGNLGAVQHLLPKLSLRQINMRSSLSAGSETALLSAIRCSDVTMELVAIVKALLAAGADPHIRAGLNNVPALACALEKTADGSANLVATNPTVGPPLVRALVAAETNINDVVSPRGYAPFHIACFDGACAEVLQVLLDAGADPSAPCPGAAFMSPLEMAALSGGDPGAVRLLIEQPTSGGLNVVGSPPDRLTPLSAAVHAGKTEVVRFLLEEGADMDLLPCDDEAPQISLIEIAATYGHLDAMNLLIQARMFKDKAEQQQQQKQQQ